jgi:hypothetical protein
VPEKPQEEQPKANGMAALLGNIASGGDNWVKIATLVLVAISGGGNFLATTKSSEFNSEEIRRGIQEIHDIHDQLQITIDRQKDMYNLVRDIDRRTSRYFQSQQQQQQQYFPPQSTPTPR